MFTGIITSIGTIDSTEMQGDLRLKIICDFKPESLQTGESIACSGACLTVVTKGLLSSGKTYFTATLSAETISRTTPGRWEKGGKLNLERALKLGDTLDGHMVTGHVDGIATIKAITPVGDSHIVEIEVPENLSRFCAEKGSITLDGVSLTVNQVKDNTVWVNVIPHTWNVTTLGECKISDRLNIEIDLIARYVARLLQK
jgi:riboflavin synthase